MLCLLGDIHGSFKELAWMFKTFENRVDAWLQVGDLGGEGMVYPDLPSNFYFIQGNHEEWRHIKNLYDTKDPHYIRNGTVIEIPLKDGTTITVAGLGGNYSSNFYESPSRNALPQSRYRHYLRKEIEELKAYRGPVDILLTHEAPAPYIVRGRQIGQETLTELTTAMRPKIHVYGHHHYHKEDNLEGIRTLCLGYGVKEPVFYNHLTGELKKVL